MKRTFAKQRLMTLLVGFFLFVAILLTAGRAGAQSLNWMQSDQAIPTLVNEVRNISNNLQNLSGQALNDAKAHVYYYKTVYNKIEGGASVEEAVNTGLDFYSGSFNSFQGTSNLDVTVDKTLKGQLFADAVNLLTL